MQQANKQMKQNKTSFLKGLSLFFMAIIIVCCQSDNEVIDLVVQDEFISIQTVEESDALKYATKF